MHEHSYLSSVILSHVIAALEIKDSNFIKNLDFKKD